MTATQRSAYSTIMNCVACSSSVHAVAGDSASPLKASQAAHRLGTSRRWAAS